MPAVLVVDDAADTRVVVRWMPERRAPPIQPFDLPLPHVHSFDAFERALRRVKALEAS